MENVIDIYIDYLNLRRASSLKLVELVHMLYDNYLYYKKYSMK